MKYTQTYQVSPEGPHKISFRHRTSWTTTLRRGRALRHGRPVALNATLLWPRQSLLHPHSQLTCPQAKYRVSFACPQTIPDAPPNLHLKHRQQRLINQTQQREPRQLRQRVLHLPSLLRHHRSRVQTRYYYSAVAPAAAPDRPAAECQVSPLLLSPPATAWVGVTNTRNLTHSTSLNHLDITPPYETTPR